MEWARNTTNSLYSAMPDLLLQFADSDLAAFRTLNIK